MKNFEITKYQKSVTVYVLPDDFSVEVERNGDLTEFYLSNNAFGDKMYMFGLANGDVETVEDIIASNAEEYIEYFFEQYGDE